MKYMRLKLLSAFFVILLIVLWAVYSPAVTMYFLSKAVSDKDYQEISEYIDYASVRSSLKRQIESQFARGAGKDGGKATTRSIYFLVAIPFIRPVVDTIVRPKTIEILMSDSGTFTLDIPSLIKRDVVGPTEKYHIERIDFDHFSVTSRTKSRYNVTLIFQRHYFGWQLSEILLPDVI